MAEATVDPAAAAAEKAALEDAARKIDHARMRQIGGYHFAMAMGVLTLWGAGQVWAATTGSFLAEAVAVGNAVVAGFVLMSIFHEWGHFTGARLSGAVSPMLEEPRRHFFLFDFDMEKNDLRQFSWMSWGGILAPWLAVLLVLAFADLRLLSSVVLLATLVFRAVAAGAFEAPIVLAAGQSGNPGAELGKAVAGGGLDRGRRVGMAVGIACFALVWLAV
ncbi:MAG: hypothetical protein AAF430_17615 [Myxococcota bacterium]